MVIACNASTSVDSVALLRSWCRISLLLYVMDLKGNALCYKSLKFHCDSFNTLDTVSYMVGAPSRGSRRTLQAKTEDIMKTTEVIKKLNPNLIHTFVLTGICIQATLNLYLKECLPT